MHYLMLVTMTLPPGHASLDARKAVYNAILTDDSFCGQGGRFGCPISDWFVIGGRWSGHLAEAMIGDDYRKALSARFPDKADKLWSLAERHRDELDSLWQALGGQGPSPYSRDSYETLGYPDDAQPLTTPLYDALLSKFEGEACVSDGCHFEYVELDGDPLTPDFVGRKWLIVVDYHN